MTQYTIEPGLTFPQPTDSNPDAVPEYVVTTGGEFNADDFVSCSHVDSPGVEVRFFAQFVATGINP